MTQVLLAIGSNVGDAHANLVDAARNLSMLLRNAKCSHIYRTAPMYVLDQPPFLNAAIVGETSLGPLPLLHRLKELERELGRRTGERFGPREIDIDLVAYGQMKYSFTDEGRKVLETPHPRVAERRFVLQPAFDIAPEMNLPGFGQIGELLNKTNDQAADVVRLEDAVFPVHCS